MAALNSALDSSLQPLVLMMAGGTGGHVYPALAVATELLARGYRVEWLGTRRGLEERVVPAAKLKLHYLAVRGVRGKGLLAKLAALFFLGVAICQAFWLLLRRAPACVIGMGGYVAAPGGIAAWLLRKPLIVHEQNAVAGSTNRLLAPLATRVLTGFDKPFVRDCASETVGNPVRADLVSAAEASRHLERDIEQRALRLLVLGGSLGAQAINEALVEALPLVRSSGNALEVLHQSGETHLVTLRNAYGELIGPALRVEPFIEDMAAAYGWADIVVCRAGALTVAELAVMGQPAVLVPLPSAIDDHQNANARVLTDSGAAILLPQDNLSGESLAALLNDIAREPQRLVTMAVAARRVAQPNSAQRVCDIAQEVMGRG